MQKKVIKINGVEYYECNGAVIRKRDEPELYNSVKEHAERNFGAVFKEEAKDASNNGNRLQVRSV